MEAKLLQICPKIKAQNINNKETITAGNDHKLLQIGGPSSKLYIYIYIHIYMIAGQLAPSPPHGIIENNDQQIFSEADVLDACGWNHRPIPHHPRTI